MNIKLHGPAAVCMYCMFTEWLQTNKIVPRTRRCCISLHCFCQAETPQVVLLFMIHSSVYLLQTQVCELKY